MKKIAIQGYEGCFHQEAAQAYFQEEIEILPCATFSKVIQTVHDKACDFGIMAIENTIAGSILPNYNLLLESDLGIIGEIHLQINQQLMVNKGVKLGDIIEVQSHYMALHQCTPFLEQYPWKQISSEDTALSAKFIKTENSRNIAAIASKTAAKIYDLEIVGENIQAEKHNYTRFLILRKKEDIRLSNQANKASISFETYHQKGNLVAVLNVIADSGINLSKLQSISIAGTDFLYRFLADLEYDNQEALKNALEKIKNLSKNIKVLGIYKKGLWN